MAKEIALYDFVEADNVDLSNFARQVTANFERTEVDVSGFSASGKNEYLPGPMDQEITVVFFQSHGSGEVFQTLYPLFRDGTAFDFAWRKNMNSSASATNPECRGTARIYTWPDDSTRGDVRTLSITFRSGDEDGFEYFYT